MELENRGVPIAALHREIHLHTIKSAPVPRWSACGAGQYCDKSILFCFRPSNESLEPGPCVHLIVQALALPHRGTS